MKQVAKKTARMNIRIPQELYFEIERVANKSGCSMSNVARICLEACILIEPSIWYKLDKLILILRDLSKVNLEKFQAK